MDRLAHRALKRAALEYGYGVEGLDYSYQGGFHSTTPCVKCGKEARVALVLREFFDRSKPSKDQYFVERIYPNDPKGAGFWVHDCVAFAIYFCTDIKCTTATTLWDQA